MEDARIGFIERRASRLRIGDGVLDFVPCGIEIRRAHRG
jgi:hypothetical protein